MKSILIAVLVTGLFAAKTQAQDKKVEDKAAENKSAEAKPELKPTKENISYAIGMNIGSNLKRQSIEANIDTLAKGINDVLEGKTTQFSEPEAQQILMAMNTELRAKQEAERKVAGEKNKKEGEAFLAENAKKPGVTILTNGLQYKILTAGTGDKPKLTDTVSTHYRGRLIDGTEFDSSYKRNQPAEFPVTGVIKGWTEALQLMPVGSKWELYIPSDLAYGERGSGRDIGANAMLIFEIELLGIKAPVESSQAVSGEIIKVPSAEELKKGAKIEVIRPGQTNQVLPK